MHLRQWLVGLMAATITIGADAQVVTPEVVLASAARHFPSVMRAQADVDAAAGAVTRSLGAFDTTLGSSYRDRVQGFYDGRYLNGTAKRRFRNYGGELYGEYGVSSGDFPIYEDEFFTNEAGEAKLGVLFSLLRDSTIDAERFGETDALLSLRQSELDLLLTRITVQRSALSAYWDWVTAGAVLDVARSLLTLGEQRQSGLEEQVRQGRRAEIFLTENQQNVTRRRSRVAAAERDLQIAANALSMFLRDERGMTITPTAEQLPSIDTSAADELRAVFNADDMRSILDTRPELRRLALAMERAERKLALAENDLKPFLDVNVEVVQPFGDIGEGGVSRDTTDAVIGLRFEVPLERREAKGDIAVARSQIAALEAERTRLSDQLAIELRDVLRELDTAVQLTELAATEAEQAATMEAAERARFRQGASDFFLVNLREEAAANARTRVFEAYGASQIARATFDAASLNLRRLGLAP